MQDFNENIILDSFTVRQALACLDKIGIYGNVLFVIDSDGIMIGTITDGDIRRGLLKGVSVDALSVEVANRDYKYVNYSDKRIDLDAVKKLKIHNIKFVPLVDEKKRLISIINLDNYKGFLPIDVFIMAGGKGVRLMPLTKDCPKPMLKIGAKPIIEHNIDRLISYGIDNFTISINYLGEVIKDYFKMGEKKGVKISYVEETEPLGTIGSVSLASEFKNEYVLVMNSDLLTDIDYSDFFEEFKESGSDLSIATIPYFVDVPYAVLEMNDSNHVVAIKEKPKYTYYSNAGIYLVRRDVLSMVPYNQFYNATDLIEDLIKINKTVSSFPILSYWLDIGKMPDYLKAQEDIKHLRL